MQNLYLYDDESNVFSIHLDGKIYYLSTISNLKYIFNYKNSLYVSTDNNYIYIYDYPELVNVPLKTSQNSQITLVSYKISELNTQNNYNLEIAKKIII